MAPHSSTKLLPHITHTGANTASGVTNTGTSKAITSFSCSTQGTFYSIKHSIKHAWLSCAKNHFAKFFSIE